MAALAELERTPRRKLADRIVESIRADLLAGSIPPGHKLPTEMQLTVQFGVSRTVVREAIAALAADGLVESRQGAGIFVMPHLTSAVGAMVADMDRRVSSALNILEVRLAIEGEGAALAAKRHNPSQLASIEEAFVEFDQKLRAGLATGPSDFSFHRAIAEATNNPYYVEMLDALGRRAIPCDATSPYSTDLAQNEHYQRGLQREHAMVLAGIRAGDADKARAAMREHLTLSQSRYQRRLYDRAAYSTITAEDIGG